MTTRPITVHIRYNASGEVREHHTTGDWDTEFTAGFSDFIWSDGNYACDCNRALFFYAWGPESDDRECGEGAFTLWIVDDTTGDVVYDERE